jgi:small subunit ribosomal protein S21
LEGQAPCLPFTAEANPSRLTCVIPVVKYKGEDRMTQVIPGESEGIESALRRFKREVSKAGIFPDMKKHRHFETPLEKRKRKAIAKRKQRRRRA